MAERNIQTDRTIITQQQALKNAVSIGKKHGKKSVEIRNIAAQIATQTALGAAESLALRKLYLESIDPTGETRQQILIILEYNNPREALYLKLSGVTREASPAQRESKKFFKQAFGQILTGLNDSELVALIDYICYEQPKGQTWLNIAAALRTMMQKSLFRKRNKEIYEKLKKTAINTVRQHKADENPTSNPEGTSSSARLAGMDSEITLEDEYGGLGWVEDAFGR
jgi:hypothetical protein